MSLRRLAACCALAALSCDPPEPPAGHAPEDGADSVELPRSVELHEDEADSVERPRRVELHEDEADSVELPRSVEPHAEAPGDREGPPGRGEQRPHPRAEPRSRAGERRIGSATARRGGVRFRFAVFDGRDPELDARGEGVPIPYRRSELSVRDGSGWRVLLESGPDVLHDLQCRVPVSYRLEIIDEQRPFVLLHARWRWRECEAGTSLAAPAHERATFVIARDDRGAMRWTELRTRLVLSTQRLVTASDGSERWLPQTPIDGRGEVRARPDGLVIHTWDGERRELRAFGPDANVQWGGDALW